MTLFYADGDDKNGDRLITSYKKRDQAERYRAGAKITEGERFLVITEQGAGYVKDAGTLKLRTMLVRSEGTELAEGPFRVYARSGDTWVKTQFSYANYAAANTAVKGALIQLYDACAVIEED